MNATLHLDTHHHVGPIERCIYGGIYDPDTPHGPADADGFRTDVLDALRTLGMPVTRSPGGNFVICYDRRDGIGPHDRRPTRVE